MSKHSMPEMKEGGVNVTPLIDVVMCLIIFFMLVAKIGVSTGASPMDLPQTIMGKKIEEIGDSIILNVKDPRPVMTEPGPDGKEQPVSRNGHIVHRNVPGLEDPDVFAVLDETQRHDPKDLPKVLIHEGNRWPLRDDMKRILDQRKKAGTEKTFSVTIRAEKDLPFSMLQRVLAEIAQAGVQNVNFGTKGKVVRSAPEPAK